MRLTKTAVALATLAVAALCSPAMAATNILPGSGATVTGSSLHSGFNESVAAGNLINGTSTDAYGNGDARWVFADNNGSETLTVNLGSNHSVTEAGFTYNGLDRIPTSSEVLTSLDGTHFKVVAGPNVTSVYGTAGHDNTTYAFAPTLAKYVEYDFGTNSIGGFGNGGGPNQGAGIYQLNIAAVPEPATWAMFLLGVGMVGATARLRRKQAACVA